MLWMAMVLMLLPGLSVGEEPRLMNCGYEAFYDRPCAEEAPVERPASPPVPLFTPQNVPPGTPTLFLDLVNNLTFEDAEKLYDWRQERMQRIWYGQQLLNAVDKQRRKRP